MKIAGVSLMAALLAGVLDRRDRALSVALGLLACAVALFGCLQSFQPTVAFVEELSDLSGLGGAYLTPLIKTAAIGMVTQLACAVCADSGQSTLAKTAELCGTAAAICMTLPLLRAVLDLICQIAGE